MASIHGYALNLGGLACLGALACGPDKPGGDGTEETSGYPLETDSSGDESSDSDSESESESESETESETTDDVPECSGRGDICGEMSVCQCDCDYSSDCCYCSPAECTEDLHCADEQGCAQVDADNWAEFVCLPAYCGDYLASLWASDGTDPELFAGTTCGRSLSIIQTTWIDLGDLEALRYLHANLTIEGNSVLTNLDTLASLEQVGVEARDWELGIEIRDNASLTSIAGLANLQLIGNGGSIANNPALPTADVEALLAQIPGGDQVEVCGNQGGDPC